MSASLLRLITDHPTESPRTALVLALASLAAAKSQASGDPDLAGLLDAEAAETKALAAIGALGAEEVAAVRAWADDPAGPMPRPDMQRRLALARDLTEAQALADAARGARAALSSTAARLKAAIAASEAAVTHAIATVIVGEMEAEGERINALRADLAAAIDHFAGLAAGAGDVAHASGDAALVRRVKALDYAAERFREPERRNFPAPADMVASAAFVEAAAARLRADPQAAFIRSAQ